MRRFLTLRSVKAKNAQLAGAIAVVVANNAAPTPDLPDIAVMSGSDPTITIPSMNAAASRGQKPARGPDGPPGGPYCVVGGG